MKKLDFNTVLRNLIVLIMTVMMVNASMSARTINIEKVRFNDPDLIREIVSSIKSDSIRKEIRKNFYPYAKFSNKKHITIGLEKYPMFGENYSYREPEIIERLLPADVCLDSCKLVVTITFDNNLSSKTFTKYYGDTLWVQRFPSNEEMNKKYLTHKAKRTYNYEVDLKYLDDFFIVQFLYINGRLYLNPNRTDWYRVYE